MSRWFAAGLLGLLLLPVLAQAAGQAPAKPGPGAPIFTQGNPAYQGISNAQANVSANTPAGAAAKLTGMVNQPPTIAWTTATNTVVTAPATFALAVNAADPDGTVAKVDYYNGGTLIGTSTAAPYGFAWSNVPYGTYTLTAIATDNLGMTATTAAITVISNAAPSVSLTAPAANTVQTAPGSFTLGANASDVDGSIARVDYYANGAPIGSATQAPYSFAWNNVPAGRYSLTAVATDDRGAQTTSSPVAVISNAAPTVSIAAPANNTVAAAPGSFTLTANAADSDGTIARVEYYNGPTLIGTATQAPYSITWSNVAAGIHTLTAVATDDLGAQTTSGAISVISDTPPAVALTTPANNAVQTAPASFTLTVDATSSMSTIAKVEFYNGTTLLGMATTAPYSFSWTNVAAGSYTITARATDGYGIANTSGAITITSNAAPSVSLTAPAANAVQTAPANFILSADATDADGTIAKVEFYATDNATNASTLLGTATTAPYSFNWNNVAAGSYAITAVATDNHGASTTSGAVTVTSNAAPTVTLTGPAAGSRITSPNSFTLSADAADSDGSIAKVEFYANDGTANTLLGSATTAPYGVIWANVPVGNYTITAVATDNLGGQTTSQAVSVTAVANVPPTVGLTGPANGATATVPGSFTLTADATSTTSAVAKVEFYAIDNATNAGTLIGTATQAPYAANWNNVAVGNYTLTAVATDTMNAQTTSSPVTVTVKTGVAQAYYIHADHLNTPRQITDASGNVVWRWDNTDPFGNNVPNENPAGAGQFGFNLRFPGQYYDRETNLNYNVNRDYDPAIGRYIESDPIGLAGGINTYGYVGGNPLSYVDPKGESYAIPVALTMGYTMAVMAGVLPNPFNPAASAKPKNSDSIPGSDSSSSSASSSSATSCPNNNEQNPCDQFNNDVQRAKDRVGSFKPAACNAGMSRFDLQQRRDAWLELAIARAIRDQKCWAGGDDGHQQAQAAAWSHVGQCDRFLK